VVGEHGVSGNLAATAVSGPLLPPLVGLAGNELVTGMTRQSLHQRLRTDTGPLGVRADGARGRSGRQAVKEWRLAVLGREC